MGRARDSPITSVREMGRARARAIPITSVREMAGKWVGLGIALLLQSGKWIGLGLGLGLLLQSGKWSGKFFSSNS